MYSYCRLPYLTYTKIRTTQKLFFRIFIPSHQTSQKNDRSILYVLKMGVSVKKKFCIADVYNVT